jgi:hypothetical protein
MAAGDHHDRSRLPLIPAIALDAGIGINDPAIDGDGSAADVIAEAPGEVDRCSGTWKTRLPHSRKSCILRARRAALGDRGGTQPLLLTRH